MRKPPKTEIAAIWRDWNGKEVYLLKEVLRDHVARYHLDETFVLSQLKAAFASPICVLHNKAVGTENAFYAIPINGNPWIRVSIRKHWTPIYSQCRVIATFFGDSRMNRSWKLLHGALPADESNKGNK